MTAILSGTENSENDEIAMLRVDLAAAFRVAAAFGWAESVGNHFSAATSANGRRFLMNPKWKHFSSINAFDLQHLDSEDDSIMRTEWAPDTSAWMIHSKIHASHPNARCLIHLHSPYATALATLKDPTLYPVCGNTARFFDRVVVDLDYDGIANEDTEGERLARLLDGNKKILMMANHGVLISGKTIASTFEDMYFFERACQTLITAYSTGREINILSAHVAQKTALSWAPYAGMADAHFSQLKEQLEICGSTYSSLVSPGKPQPLKL